MKQVDPKLRPTTIQVHNHPPFWTPERKLEFIGKFGDTMKAWDTSLINKFDWDD